MANSASYTYDDKSVREDLLGIITNLDYKETQLFSGLGSSEAKSIYHQWMTDTLDTPSLTAVAEGADLAVRNLTNPARLTNVTQIVAKPFIITGTDEAVEKAGIASRKSYEATKAMKAFKQDFEYALLRSSLVCGTGSTARQMLGLKYWLSNVTAQSGTSLTETMLNDYLQTVWNAGTQVNAVYCPMYIKRKISAFTAGNTKNIPASDKRLVNAVDIYQADAASNVKLFAHYFVTVSGDTNYDVVGINEDMFRIAWLRKPFIQEVAQTGDATKSQVIGEGTLECLHNSSGFLTRAVL